MSRRLRVLLVEDSLPDAELLLDELMQGGYEVTATRVETAEAMRTALSTETWDVVLSDYSLPTFSAPGALTILRETGLDLPFIIVSGTIGEETAVTALKSGASDFLVKSRLARLIPALERELRERELRRERVRTQHILEEQLRQAQKMEAIGQLAGGIAHDFNNLLTAILGYCELLTDQIGPDKPMGQDLREISLAAQRAAALTRQLLAFSRKQVLTVTAIDLNEVVRTIEPMLGRLLGEQISIRTALAQDLPAVMADTTQLEQVLVNLAVNARDAMPQGGELTISTRRTTQGMPATSTVTEAPDAFVVLSVSDTGTGMTPELQTKIFEPFFTTKVRGKGTGLGLAAVHGIVCQLGGAIEVESTAGQGTTFQISFPATQMAAQIHQTTTVEPSPVGSETVLVVEDEPGVRAFIIVALRRFGYRVIDADSAEAALQRLAQLDTPVHLLLTDVILPRMGGRELADRVVQAHPGIPVLFMSGYSEEMTTASGLLEPSVQLIEKPFTVQTLLTKTRQLLDSRTS